MMTFADLVVHVDDQLKSHSDGLLKKAAQGRITWATKEIIHYLGQTPSIDSSVQLVRWMMLSLGVNSGMKSLSNFDSRCC